MRKSLFAPYPFEQRFFEWDNLGMSLESQLAGLQH